MNAFSFVWGCELLSWIRQRNEWDRSHGHKAQPPIIVYLLPKVTRHCWEFHTSFYIQMKVPTGKQPSHEWLSRLQEKTVNSQTLGDIISYFQHFTQASDTRVFQGEADLYTRPADNVKVRSGTGIFHPFPGHSQVPRARWNQSISNGGGHRHDTIRSESTQSPSSTAGSDTHISSYCHCSHLKNYMQLVLVFLRFLFLKHDFHSPM